MTGGRGHQRFRQALIVGQFALTMILLAARAVFICGLIIKQQPRKAGSQSASSAGTVASHRQADPEKIATFHG